MTIKDLVKRNKILISQPTLELKSRVVMFELNFNKEFTMEQYICKYCPIILKAHTKELLMKKIGKHLHENHWEEMVIQGKKLRKIRDKTWVPENNIDYFIM